MSCTDSFFGGSSDYGKLESFNQNKLFLCSHISLPNAWFKENNGEEISCKYDWLEIHDGDNLNSKMKFQLCGYEIPSNVNSSGSSLTLKFQSDNTNDLGKVNGFKIIANHGFNSQLLIESLLNQHAPCR